MYHYNYNYTSDIFCHNTSVTKVRVVYGSMMSKYKLLIDIPLHVPFEHYGLALIGIHKSVSRQCSNYHRARVGRGPPTSLNGPPTSRKSRGSKGAGFGPPTCAQKALVSCTCRPYIRSIASLALTALK